MATLPHPAGMVEAGPQRNSWLGKLYHADALASPPEDISTRAQRADFRLCWEQRLARNARPSDAPPLFVTLYGLPATFAHSFGFALLATA